MSSLLSAIRGTENGIVSKKLLSAQGGSITLFAFDENQSLDRHSTPSKAMVIGLEGEATFLKGSESIILKKNSFIVLQENEEHSLTANTSFKMMLVLLKP